MEELEIRKASKTDIPLIRQLTMQVWPQTYTPIVGGEQVAYMLNLFYAPEELRKQMDEKNHQFIICYSKAQPVAFASWSQMDGGICKLHKIYILPGQQGKGIGRYMIAYIVNDIKTKNATALHLNVNRYNYSAKAFYEKIGFQQFKEEDIDIGNGYFMNDYVLSLSI